MNKPPPRNSHEGRRHRQWGREKRFDWFTITLDRSWRARWSPSDRSTRETFPDIIIIVTRRRQEKRATVFFSSYFYKGERAKWSRVHICKSIRRLIIYCILCDLVAFRKSEIVALSVAAPRTYKRSVISLSQENDVRLSVSLLSHSVRSSIIILSCTLLRWWVTVPTHWSPFSENDNHSKDQLLSMETGESPSPTTTTTNKSLRIFRKSISFHPIIAHCNRFSS